MPLVLRLVRAAMAAAIVVALTYQLVRSLQHTDLGVVSFFSYFTPPWCWPCSRFDPT